MFFIVVLGMKKRNSGHGSAVRDDQGLYVGVSMMRVTVKGIEVASHLLLVVLQRGKPRQEGGRGNLMHVQYVSEHKV